MILKNTTGQGVYLLAYNKTTGAGLAGDQANITGAISKDGAAEGSFTTTNPTNIGGGLYWQPLSQSETNCNSFGMRWVSSTTDVLIDPITGFTDQGRIDATISSRAPSSTAMSNATWTDAKAAFIDAAISSRMATFVPSTPPTVVQIRTEMDSNSTKLANLDATISSRAVPGNAMTLTSGERTAIANEVEQQIIDETDSEHVLTAITSKIASVNPDLGGLTIGAIASGVRTNLAIELGRIDENVSTRLAASDYAASGSPTAVQIRTEMDSNSTKLANLDASVSSRSTYNGGPVDAVVDRTGFSLAPAGLDQISTVLSGPRSAWKFPQWMMFKGLRLARSRKNKSTGDIDIYDAATQNTVIYTLATTDNDTEQTVGSPT